MRAGVEGGRTAQLAQTFPLLLGAAGGGGECWEGLGAGRRLANTGGAICVELSAFPSPAMPCPALPSPLLPCSALPSLPLPGLAE